MNLFSHFKYLLKKVLKLDSESKLRRLVRSGLTIGNNFQMMGECIIDNSHCWHIKIGDNVTLAPRVHILAHDASTKIFLDYTKVKNVTIGSNVFIGAGSIILPGVEIGDNVIIAAGSVVTHKIDSNCIVGGNPAKFIMTLHEHLEKCKAKMNPEHCFEKKYSIKNNPSSKMKSDMYLSAEKNGVCFIR